MTKVYKTSSAAETIALGEEIGRRLKGGDLIAYSGGLGAGKTTITRGISIGMGLGDEVTSPTFALVNEYRGDRLSLIHFDMYRINSADDLETTGFFDYMDEDTVLAVEWSENIAEELPEDALRIDIQRIDEDSRAISITAPREMIDLKILAIDTSGKVASVAVTDGEKLLWEKSVYTKLTHSQVILPMVKQALEETGLTYTDLDCAAIAKGPGSYTGLRIGVAAVKGMCFGCESLKSAGVSTLLSLAYNCIGFEGRIISVMRARPKIVYAGEFQCKNGVVTRISADRVCPEEEVFSGEFSEKTMLVGDCAAEIKAKYFADNENVQLASYVNRLQRASSLCLVVEAQPEIMVSADRLEVSYLQATKAEKDKAHRDK